MTDPATTHTFTEPGLALQYDPNELVVAANVRRNVALDPDFLASIREHGILVPISVWWDDIADAFQVLDGQRRTLAAREVGLTTVPIWTVPAVAGEDQRITQQLTVNDRRKSLDDSEEAAAVHDLALFGLTADTIRRRTSIPKARVQQALAVASNPAAQQLLTEQPITLEHAAAIAEFAGEDDLVEQLTWTATTNPDLLDGHIDRARREAQNRVLVAHVRDELEAKGVPVLDSSPSGAWARVREFAHEDGSDITEDEAIEGGASAWVTTTHVWVTPKGRVSDDEDPYDDPEDDEDQNGHYEQRPFVSYVIQDPAAHGWVNKYNGITSTRPAVASLEDKRAARARNLEWKTATEARVGFLRALVANKITTVRQPAALMLIALHSANLLPRRDFNAATHTEEWLNTTKGHDSDRDYGDYHRFGAYLTGNPTRAINLALTLAVTDIEGALSTGKPQESVQPDVSRYLQALTVLGHILTPIEQRAAGITPDPDELEQADQISGDAQ